MGWFDDQVRERKQKQSDLLNDSFQNIARSVTGHRIDNTLLEGSDVKAALSQLLKYYNVKEKEIPAKITALEDKLDYELSAAGILYRRVRLDKGWQNDAMGAMIGSMKGDDAVITILPEHSGGFSYVDPHTGAKVKIRRAQAELISEDAFCFYRPLPMRSLKSMDLWKYMAECLTTWDIISFVLAAAAITGLGLFLPRLNRVLMSEVVDYGSTQLLAGVMSFMVCITIGSLMFSSMKQLLIARINTKLSVNMNAAMMMRLLSLPADFFKDYSAGELNQYMNYAASLCSTIINSLVSTGLTGLFSLVYLTQIFSYARALVLPSILVTLLTLAASMLAASMQMAIGKEQMKISAKESGLVYAFISGVQKIRLAGAERRAFAKWADIYAEESTLQYNPPSFLKLSKVITTAISLCGTIVIYYAAVKSSVSVADYYAFNSAYAYISGAFTSLASVATTAAAIRPVLDMIKPLMDAEPEIKTGLETVTSLSGSIELSHVSFRYKEESPLILDDLSLTIPSKQYVAIVGKTGCGKSTLMRLLLGFETPTRGSIFYDRKDTRTLDMGSVRKKIGTVLQDCKLFQGSIFENIAISAPSLTMDEAWEAAEIAGIADDIRNMPMGMQTMISEGSGGISGGQRQRLMIARAVAPKPKILFMDEATSALDNIMQKQVCEALDAMHCTRIVIAHRLSTIRHCDRILVMDKGAIIEDGTYEQLIEKKGFFAELVERQRV